MDIVAKIAADVGLVSISYIMPSTYPAFDNYVRLYRFAGPTGRPGPPIIDVFFDKTILKRMEIGIKVHQLDIDLCDPDSIQKFEAALRKCIVDPNAQN